MPQPIAKKAGKNPPVTVTMMPNSGGNAVTPAIITNWMPLAASPVCSLGEYLTSYEKNTPFQPELVAPMRKLTKPTTQINKPGANNPVMIEKVPVANPSQTRTRFAG